MKKYFLIALLCAMVALVGCAKEAEARGYDGDVCDSYLGQILNKCVDHPANPEVEPNREQFDYGLYVHLILWEAEDGNWEIGNWNTWEVNRGEVTSLLGVKIYLNRLAYQK
jgi:hypothetical protein